MINTNGSLEKNFNAPFTAILAQREKKIQQNYRPIIVVHKWFARRPGTVFRKMAYWIVRQSLVVLDISAFADIAKKVTMDVEKEIGELWPYSNKGTKTLIEI